MGPRAYLQRRRRRESALSRLALDPVRDGAVEGPGDRGQRGSDGHEPGAAGRERRAAARAPRAEEAARDPVELPGADPAELASMLGRALAGGTPQISTDSHRVRGGGVAEEILALLAEVGAPAGERGVAVAPGDAEQLLERVRARIAALERDRDG